MLGTHDPNEEQSANRLAQGSRLATGVQGPTSRGQTVGAAEAGEARSRSHQAALLLSPGGPVRDLLAAPPTRGSGPTRRPRPGRRRQRTALPGRSEARRTTQGGKARHLAPTPPRRARSRRTTQEGKARHLAPAPPRRAHLPLCTARASATGARGRERRREVRPGTWRPPQSHLTQHKGQPP